MAYYSYYIVLQWATCLIPQASLPGTVCVITYKAVLPLVDDTIMFFTRSILHSGFRFQMPCWKLTSQRSVNHVCYLTSKAALEGLAWVVARSSAHIIPDQEGAAPRGGAPSLLAWV